MTESVLGRQAVETDRLDRIPVDDLAGVEFFTDELVALCPVTSGPDIYDLTIRFAPRAWSVETKSLKLWLRQYRERGIFAEDLAAEIAKEVAATVEVNCEVTLVQHVRGGIVTTVTAVR